MQAIDLPSLSIKSEPEPRLIKAMQSLLIRLALVSQVRAARIDSTGSHPKPTSAPPRGAPLDLPRVLAKRFWDCDNNRERLIVIAEAQRLLRMAKLPPPKALIRGTREWRLAIATDKRISLEVALTYDVSSSYVRTLRGRLQAGKL